MFEITMPQAIGVLPIQHEAMPDSSNLAIGQDANEGQRPPTKFISEVMPSIGQSEAGGPFPPSRFTFINETVVSIGQDEGPRPPPPIK